MLNFGGGTAKLFSKLSTVILQFHTQHEDSSISTSSPTLVPVFSYFSHFRGCEVMSHGFDWHFLVTADVEQLLSCLLAICISSWRNDYSNCCLISDLLTWLCIV